MMTGRGDLGGKGAAGGPTRHIPVLLQEVLTALRPAVGERYIDGTFGAGGYTAAILEAAECQVLAIDRDPAAIVGGASLQERFGERLKLLAGQFSQIEALATDAEFSPVNGIVLDIGVSSMQLDEAERGFSFQADGPLDMRMSQAGPSAADFLNTADEFDIADVLWRYGDERRSRAIARAVVADRGEKPFLRTADFAELVARILGRRDDGKHPATRAFQALRIHVNEELGELERALAAAERLLAEGGRLVVVTFHSLEDRIVKSFLRERTGRQPQQSRHMPGNVAEREPTFRFVNHRPVSPGEAELASNPRARSAQLRSAVRTAAQPWPDASGGGRADAARGDRSARGSKSGRNASAGTSGKPGTSGKTGAGGKKGRRR